MGPQRNGLFHPFGVAGSGRLAGNLPPLYLVPALSTATSLVPAPDETPCGFKGLRTLLLSARHHNQQLSSGPFLQQAPSFMLVEESTHCAPSQEHTQSGEKFLLKMQSVRPKYVQLKKGEVRRQAMRRSMAQRPVQLGLSVASTTGASTKARKVIEP